MFKVKRQEKSLVLPPPSNFLLNDDGYLASEIQNYLQNKKEIIVFSPHLDDAVLSMGSLLAFLVNSKKRVRVVTVFTQGSDLQSTLTSSLISNADCSSADEYFQLRRKEDVTSLRLLGVKHVDHLGFTDAAWRKKTQSEGLYPKTTIGVSREDRDKQLLAEIKDVLGNITTDKETAVFAPLGWGRHVDHVIVHEACKTVFPKAIFYKDFPYSQKFPHENITLKQGYFESATWISDFYNSKAMAVLAYESQLEALCKDGPLKLQCETFAFPKQARSG